MVLLQPDSKSPEDNRDPIHVFSRIWIIPLFCSSRVPWDLAGKFSAAKAAGSVSNLHIPRPPATPGTHHHHREEEKRAKPGSCPPTPVGAQHLAQVLPPKPLLPTLSLSQKSQVLHILLRARHLEQRASRGLSAGAWAGMEGGQHKEQHFGQEMDKRALLPESRELPKSVSTAGLSTNCLPF